MVKEPEASRAAAQREPPGPSRTRGSGPIAKDVAVNEPVVLPSNENAAEAPTDALELDPVREPPVHGADDRAIDLALVRRAQTGDQGAFRELFDRYHRRVYAVAFGVLKNPQDAADCVQDGFVKVFRHLPSFEGTSSFYTWLYRIVMNLAIDQLRRRKTSRPVEFDEGQRECDEPAEDAIVARLLDENPRKSVLRKELVARMRAALDELPEYHRQVILLREIEGLSYEEMAEVLDVPKGTIMSRLFHARKKMQDALRGYIDDDLDFEE